ncbi:MAG: TIGR01620 family protein [Rhizobiaceae bacterium]|nr:TIGR01620 family protein [Rhizobiaceae bacterium]
MNSTPRRPAAFRIDPPAEQPRTETQPVRKPRAVKTAEAVVTPDAVDVFEAMDEALEATPVVVTPKRRSRLGTIFIGAFGLLASLAIGLWVDSLIRDLFSRADWLGWTAAGLAAVAGFALLAIILREMLALRRLASVEKLQRRAARAAADPDQRTAKALVDDLVSFLSSKPETAAGRQALAALRDDVIDGPDLIRLAETELMGPLDLRARTLVTDAAKRVSLVTAISPRAIVDLAYVTWEAARLVRRLSELYGARPGTLGFLRLLRSTLAHLAVTGTIAAGDSFVQQLVGQGLAARLSAKLGEGVVNGMMTARIGIAAIEATRPLPFVALKRPGLGDILAVLTRLAARGDGKVDAS